MKIFLFVICLSGLFLAGLFGACTRRICPAYSYQAPEVLEECLDNVTVPEAPRFNFPV